MTKDEIMALALESGMSFLLEEHASEYGNGTFWNTPYPELEGFANLVASVEREECAKLCEKIGDQDCGNHAWDATYAIRARGDK